MKTCSACNGRGHVIYPSGSTIDCGLCMGTGNIETGSAEISHPISTAPAPNPKMYVSTRLCEACKGIGETLTIDQVIPCYTLNDGDSLMLVFKGKPTTKFYPGDEIVIQKK